MSNFRSARCFSFWWVFWGSNFRPDWRIQVNGFYNFWPTKTVSQMKVSDKSRLLKKRFQRATEGYTESIRIQVPMIWRVVPRMVISPILWKKIGAQLGVCLPSNQNPFDIPFYWLVNRDPYFMAHYNPYIDRVFSLIFVEVVNFAEAYAGGPRAEKKLNPSK